jgi:AcrR family transcriptional regulator
VERRRARVRQRIADVTEALVRSRGIDAVTVEDITEAADVARRTFYHHFGSKNDVLVPLARARTEELNRRIDRVIEGTWDAAEGVSIGLRHTLRRIPEDPLCAWFIFRSGLPHERLREGIGESGARDLERGIAQGRFTITSREVVASVVGGALIGLLSRRLHGMLEDAQLDEAVAYLLRLLGVPLDEAEEIAQRPLPPLP